MPHSLFRAALSASILAAFLPAAAQDAPVREVTLFETGVVEITRSAGGNREVMLRVPLRDVGDVLQSIAPRGEGTTGLGLSLAGETPVDDAFAVLPFRPGAATSLVALLREVPGMRVRVSERGDPEGRVGTVVGVEEECADTGATGCSRLLSLLDEEGTLHWHALGEGLRITILDREIAAALPRGLAVLREAASGMTRDIAVTLEGENPQDGGFSYVIAAPPWKATYRARTGSGGEATLQAQAVVENATGEDWEDIRLTLSSAAPRVLVSDLHRRGPPTPGAADPPSDAPEKDAEPEPSRGFLGIESVTPEEAVDRMMPPAPEPVAAPEPRGDQGSGASFVLDETVSIGVGQMLSVPFLAESPQARLSSVWTGTGESRTGHPARVLEVGNVGALRLPAGVVTVSDERGGFLGEVAMPALDPASSLGLAFAPDRALRVDETVIDRNRLISAVLQDGVLRVTVEQIHDARYRLASAGALATPDREVMIHHPVLRGWDLEVAVGPEGRPFEDGTGQDWLRFAVPFEGGGGQLVLRQSRLGEDVRPISHMTPDAIRVWAERVPDSADRAVLLAAAPLVERWYEARNALRRAMIARDELLREQERVRRLLDSAPRFSMAHGRLSRDLIELENRIAAANEAVRTAEAIAETAADAVYAIGREDGGDR